MQVENTKQVVNKKKNNRRRKPRKSKMLSEEAVTKTVNRAINQNQRMLTQRINSIKTTNVPVKYVNYMHQLMNPESYLTHCPDDVVLPTGLYKSIKNYTITVDPAANGQFSIVVQPKIGSNLQTDFFGSNVLIQKPNGLPNIPIDNTYWDNYTDPVADEMFSPDSSLYGIAAASMRPTGSFFLSGGLPSSGSGGPYVVDPKSNINLNWVGMSQPFTLQAGSMTDGTAVAPIPVTFANSNGYDISAFGGLSGWYDVTVGVVNTNTSALNVGLNQSLYFVEINRDFSAPSGYLRSTTGNLDAYQGVFASPNRWSPFSVGAATTPFDWLSTVTAVNQQSLGTITWRVNLDESKYYAIFQNLSLTAAIGINSIYLTVQIHSLNDATEFAQNTLVQNIRPIAQSVLCSFVAPPGFVNGTLAIANLPIGSTSDWIAGTDRSYSTLTSGTYPLSMYVGAANKGAYTFWIPGDSNARELKTYSDHCSTDYGSVVIVGNVNSNAINSAFVAFSMRVVTIYEYTTTKRLLSPVACLGDLSTFSKIIGFLADNERAFENPTHLKRLLDIAKETLGPMASNFFRKTVPNAASKLQEANRLLTPIINAAQGITGLETITGLQDLLPLLASMI